MKNISQWQHLKKNYLALMIFMFGMGILALFTMEPNIKWVSVFFFVISLVVIPVGNYLSWKSKR